MSETKNTVDKTAEKAARAFAQASSTIKTTDKVEVEKVEEKAKTEVAPIENINENINDEKTPTTIEAEVVMSKPEVNNASNTSSTPIANGEKKKGSKVWIIVILVIALLLCCGCGTIALVSKVGWDAIKNLDFSELESEFATTSTDGLTKVEGDYYIMYYPSTFSESFEAEVERNFVSNTPNATGGINSINMVSEESELVKPVSSSDCSDLADLFEAQFQDSFDLDSDEIFAYNDFETKNGVNICKIEYTMYYEDLTLYTSQKILSTSEDNMVVVYTMSTDSKYSDEGELLENALELSTIK